MIAEVMYRRSRFFHMLVLLPALFLCSMAYASETNGQILDKLRKRLDSYGIAEIRFTFRGYDDFTGEPFSTSGTAYLKGDEYRIVSGPVQIVSCDGVKQIYNSESDELVMMSENAASSDLVENPFCIFRSSVYDVSPSSAAVSRNGMHVLKFVHNDENYQYREIYVYVTSSGDPAKVTFSSVSGTDYSIEIESVKNTAEAGVLAVSGISSDTFVTDLR